MKTEIFEIIQEIKDLNICNSKKFELIVKLRKVAKSEVSK